MRYYLASVSFGGKRGGIFCDSLQIEQTSTLSTMLTNTSLSLQSHDLSFTLAIRKITGFIRVMQIKDGHCCIVTLICLICKTQEGSKKMKRSRRIPERISDA